MTAPPGPAVPRPPRRFSAEDILHGRVNLDGYPFRFIYVVPVPSSGFRVRMATPERIEAEADLVFSAVELLETRGWQVVNFTRHDHVIIAAYLRRVSP